MNQTNQNEYNKDQFNNLVKYYQDNPNAPVDGALDKRAKEQALLKVEPPKKLLNFRGKRLNKIIDVREVNPMFLIDEYFISVNSMCRIIGESFAGKTILMKHLALCAILHLPFMGCKINLASDKTILFIELEGAEENHMIQNNRIFNSILAENPQINREWAIEQYETRFLMEYMPNLNFNNEKESEAFSKEIAEEIKVNNIGVIIIDNQTALTNRSETSSNEDKIRWILDAFTKALNTNVEFPCYCFLIHHFNKSGVSSGSHQLRAASVNEFELQYKDGKRWLEHTKSAMKTNPKLVYIKYEDKGEANINIPQITTELCVSEDTEQVDKIASQDRAVEQVAKEQDARYLALLTSPMNKSALAKLLGVNSGAAAFKRQLVRLVEAQLIEELPTAGKEILIQKRSVKAGEIEWLEAAE